MMFIGMVFQYNNEEGNGLIMLSSGDSKAFSKNDWKDESIQPSIGKEISYEETANGLVIKAISPEEKKAFLENEKANKEKSFTPEAKTKELSFSSVDEYIIHFKGLGYKLAKDADDGTTRTVSLRIFLEDGHGETIVTSKDAQITVKTMVNGKEVR